jgi:nucleotidyltransferase substrate binding protein (TIGR01987 family)
MKDRRSAQSLENLGRALARLHEALDIPESNPLAIDGTIQRFEFVIELLWKTLRQLLEREGIRTGTPREALARAYQSHWIDDEETWIHMLDDRNATSHVYREEQARAIYGRIRDYVVPLDKAHAFLKRLAE